jgi:hypothetical protein
MDNLQLEITKSDAKEMLDFYQKKVKQFVADNHEVFEKLQQLTDMTAKLQRIIDSPGDKDYPLGGSWNQRIQYFLQSEPEGLTARQITKRIMKIEGIYNEAEEKRIYSGVSPTLSSGAVGLVTPIYERKNNEKNEYVYSIKK